MRILLVTHFFPAHGGGVEQVAAQLMKRMVGLGAEVTWCASDTDPPPAQPGLHCEPMACFNGVERLTGRPYPLWSPASLRRLAQLVQWADGVHVHDCVYFGSMMAALFAKHHAKPLAVTQHIGQVPLPSLLRPGLALLNRIGAHCVLQQAEGVAFISPAVRRYFERLLGPSSRFRDVPNGVDTTVFSPVSSTPAEARAALGFDAKRPLMLFVGRFVPIKRLSIIREMAAQRPDWQWCLVGQGPERPEAWEFDNVCVRPQMPQTSLREYYGAADLLVLPSLSEGFPLVVQEALACGLPTCMTANVAAGSSIPSDVWLELPEAADATASAGLKAIQNWLAYPTATRLAQRSRCAQFASGAWSWERAALAHLEWLAGEAH